MTIEIISRKNTPADENYLEARIKSLEFAPWLKLMPLTIWRHVKQYSAAQSIYKSGLKNKCLGASPETILGCHVFEVSSDLFVRSSQSSKDDWKTKVSKSALGHSKSFSSRKWVQIYSVAQVHGLKLIEKQMSLIELKQIFAFFAYHWGMSPPCWPITLEHCRSGGDRIPSAGTNATLKNYCRKLTTKGQIDIRQPGLKSNRITNVHAYSVSPHFGNAVLWADIEFDEFTNYVVWRSKWFREWYAPPRKIT